MKKKISKLIAVLLSVVILFAQTIPTFAALTEGTKYSFTTTYLDAYYDTGTWETADGHTHDDYGQVALRNLSNGEPLYCIQIYNAVDNSAATAESITQTNLWKNELTYTARQGITRASIYGYPNYTYGYSATEAQLATQVLIWEFEIDRRHDYSVATTSFASNIFSNYPNALKCYLAILEACSDHQSRPSFNGTTVTLKGIGSSNAVTVTDTNGVLSNFSVSSSNSNIIASVSGNNLTVYATEGGAISGTITLTKENTDTNSAFALTGANQTLFYGTIADPVTTSIRVELSLGSITIQKNSEDGIVSDITFKVTGSDGSSYTATTNSKGTATISDLPVYDSNNKITYTVQETSVPVRYVTPDSQTVTLTADLTPTVTFNNVLKKFRVKVVKSDIEKGTAQGDASLAGATYGIYKNGELVDTYTTDSNASFTTDYYVCDTDWTIQEISASEGYLVNDEIYSVGADPKLYELEYNTTAVDVTEQVIKGNIAIIKHSDDGSSKIETPEENAQFQIYLKASGSYDKADEDERDLLVTDEYGFAQSKDLPYGIYTVHQIKGTEGTEYIADFDVYIQSDGETYRYLINDPLFSSYMKIVKTDSETGKQIAYEGAGFQIYDSDGNLVTMKYTYPSVTVIDTFYTNSEGYLITPEKLDYGEYTLVEVQAPYGYVLDSTPISFTIEREASYTDEDFEITIVEVTAQDMSQKGIIEITKTGEIFSSVTENKGIYTPVYETQNLANAVFQIYAAEDITTLDGTIRAYQGELVDEITTSDSGIAKSKELYLGKYTVVELTAPDTFYNDGTTYDITLTYQGQEVDVYTVEQSVYNERQNVTVSLTKAMEQDEIFNLGNNNEILSVQFGIYANEDITAADGSVIPADSLITYGNCDENGELIFSCDLPIGYKFYAKETATDTHYILSDTKYEFDTEYQGQDIETIEINLNEGEPIVNELIYGSIKGYKTDRETGETIEGALFGLFNSDETEFTEDTAILICETDKDGIFAFEDIPYGNWLVKEIQPAENYLASDDIHHITVSENEQLIEIHVVNDKIPELKTTATVDGEKKITAQGEITIEDVVEYKHLIPGREYVLKGVLMDKSTGKALVINGKTVTAEVTFIPAEPSGTVTVEFTFDSSGITKDTDIVVFESLYKDGTELAVHADIEDEGQTVTVTVPLGILTLCYGNLTSPKTGADYAIFAVSLAAVCAIAVTAAFAISKKRRTQQ